MFRFESLEIWRLAMQYGKDCYRIANGFPKYETYGLGDQLRRASVSPSNNIAEGSVGTSASFRRYLTMAIASVLETVNIIRFAFEIQYIEKKKAEEMYERAEELVRKMMNFSKSLR